MFTSLRFGGVFLALTFVVQAPLATRAVAVTVEVARKCKALTDIAYPPREPGNPAAGSEKGGGRVAQDFFNKCVANGGEVDQAPPTQVK